MFYVTDTLESRHSMIRSYYKKDCICIAALLAAADFEWTLRRTIISLGTEPTTDVRIRIERYHKLRQYIDVWNKQIVKNPLIRKKKPWASFRLKAVIPDWDFLSTKAMRLRNQIIHGYNTNSGLDYAKDRCESLLKASETLVALACSHGVDLYIKLPVRRRLKVSK